MVIDIVLYTLGFLGLIEGIYLFAFPYSTRRIIMSLFKNVKEVRKWGFIELIISLILIALGLVI